MSLQTMSSNVKSKGTVLTDNSAQPSDFQKEGLYMCVQLHYRFNHSHPLCRDSLKRIVQVLDMKALQNEIASKLDALEDEFEHTGFLYTGPI
jgi:hypothetical protein